jgi:hypothetical protein
MRMWMVPFLGLLLGGCALPTGSDSPGSVPLTWSGEFKGGPSNPGHITLLLDEAGPTTWTGTMFFESHETDGDQRATYRIEGTREDGAVHVRQAEILEADGLSYGRGWCLGTYELSLADPAESAQHLGGSYSGDGDGCAGTTTLDPTESL